MLVAFGVAAVIAAIVLMIAMGRSRPAADAVAVDVERPAMDRVQREDLERRAEEEQESRNRLWMNMVGGLVVGGLACGAFGGFLAATTQSAIDNHKRQLRQAASDWLSVVVDGPRTCQEIGAFPDPVSGAQSSGTRCSASPRDYANQQITSTAYIEFPLKTVFSATFQSDGEVTFHDTLNNRAVCVRVPATGSAVDLQADVTSGACPDAPVSDDSAYQENTSP
jgi:hypothetical protein